MPTSLIHEPTLETTVAIHSMRNHRLAQRLPGETNDAGVVSTCASRTSLTLGHANLSPLFTLQPPLARPGEGRGW